MAKKGKTKKEKQALSDDKEKILNRIRRKLTLDKEYMDECAAYDDMDAMVYNMPASLAVREEVRKRVSTDGHDVLKTAVNLFDTQHPKWEILPRGPADAEKAEELERWLEWHMLIANQQGDTEPYRLMLKHAAKYGRIATQLDFLPYWCTEGTDEYKEAMAHPFCISVYPGASIHYERGKYALRWVAPVSNIPAADCIDHWDAYQGDSVYGEKIKSAIRKIEVFLEDDDEARLMYVDYTDKDTRWVFAYLAQSNQVDCDLAVPDDGTFVEILFGDNKLGFINWEISVVASEPLLYSMHKGGIYENQCLLETVADTTVLRRAFFPYLKHNSNSGKPLEVDFSGTEPVIELNSADGETAEVLSPPALDPGIREMMDRVSSKAASATGLKGLSNMSNLAGNVQFATINAQIQLSKSNLDPFLTATQHNAAGLGRLAFMWVAKTGITVTGHRAKDKNKDKNKVKGEKINVGPNDFDATTMVIQCELLSTSPSDEMQRMNVFSQAKQIGIPISGKQIVERMGWGDGDVVSQDWLKEKIEEMALASFQKWQDGQLQITLQQMMTAAQKPPEPPTGGTPSPAGTPPPEQMGGAQMMPGGIGNDPNQGGVPPAMSSPQETRTMTQRPQ